MRRLITLCDPRAAALLVLLSSATALASDRDKLTTFTFNAPVQVPGRMLPAGTYQFKVTDPMNTDRNVVQVFTEDGRTLLVQFFTMRGIRHVDQANDPILTFRETAAGVPKAIRGWHYPGERTAFEFIYSEKQRELIAGRGTQQPALASAATTP
jgi:hypothetical protein